MSEDMRYGVCGKRAWGCVAYSLTPPPDILLGTTNITGRWVSDAGVQCPTNEILGERTFIIIIAFFALMIKIHR